MNTPIDHLPGDPAMTNFQPNSLSTFRVLFIVKGILTLLFSLFALAYAFVGVFFFNMDEFRNAPDPMPFNPGIIFMVIGLIGFAFLTTLGILTLVAAKYFRETRRYNFIFVTAILNCFTGLLGILPGVFTLIELNKPHVKKLFGRI